MYAAITDLRNRARALDDTADHLAHRISSMGWQGAAADAMRSRAAAAVSELRRCAHLHDAAATALDHHRRAALATPVGHAVEEAVGLARGVMSAVGGLL
ncbi:MAG TPA: hypothetical protein VFA96_08540 [Nocardioides sp.]|nr:hypothetical protein [Nocardioides sp.]